jgi:hypothetical protein
MKTTILRGLPFAATCAGLLFAGAAHSQAAAAGPFTKVPPLTTQCYTGTDPFEAKLDAASEAVAKEYEKQSAINAKIEEDFQSIDPMEMAAKMQQWMMSNPQEAMKYAQGAQATGEALNTAVPELNAATAKFDAERKDLRTKYQAALNTAYAPADARMAAMNKKLADANECGFGDTECRVPDWAWAEYDAVQKQRDAAYLATCAQWWVATSPIQGYLKRYRDWLTQKWIPSWVQNDQARITQYAIMNTPAASYKSTIPYQSAIKYMGVVRELFAMRDTKPICNAKGCRGQ